MSTKASMRLALALLVAMGTQGATATAARTTAHLRAITCCAKVCHKAKPVSATKRCCQVRESGAELGTIAPGPARPAASVARIVPAAALVPTAPTFVVGLLDHPPQRAGPIFRLTRTLRL